MVLFFHICLFSSLLWLIILKDSVAFVSSVPSDKSPLVKLPFLARPLVAATTCLHQSITSTSTTTTIVTTESSSKEEDKSVCAATAASPEQKNNKNKPNDAGTHILAAEEDFIKPELDSRQYRCIQLQNNLQVLLVSTAVAAAGADNDDGKDNDNDDDDDDDDDASSHVEAAAVHVQAGHMDDTIAGLAHFHEHMLFLGTQKYPDENEYEGFLSKYGGYSNAYTDMEDTNYYFTVTTSENTTSKRASEALHGGLDRLSQFFISPTFEESMVERELKAVDSEYRNSRTSDTWRNFQLLKSSCEPHHPFHNFGCGNYDTLTGNSTESPRPLLWEFWNKYYKTSNLRLAVVGHSSLDALQTSVEETFGKLKHSDEPHRRSKVNPASTVDKNNNNSIVFEKEHSQYNGLVAFGPEQVGKIKEVKPLLESRSIKLHFPTPPLADPVMRQSKPHRVISHLLGHESPGSLHCLLSDMGYLNGLSSGVSIDISDFSMFTFTLSLTPEGMKAREEVLSLAFQWMALIKDSVTEQPELMEQYQAELNQIAKNKFRFRENGEPIDFCSSASELMFDQITPPERILVASSEVGEYNHDVALEFLKRLRPENCLIFVTDSDLKDDDNDDGTSTSNNRKDNYNNNDWTTEPWYGARHRTLEVSQEQMKIWEFPETIDSRLHLPELNKYIPSDFSLRSDDDDDYNGDVTKNNNNNNQKEEEKVGTITEETKIPPTLVTKTANYRLWHKMDRHWRVPKTVVRVSLVSPTTYKSPRTMTYSRIFQRVLNDDLNSFVYDAGVAGCSYSVSCTPNGWRISVSGFSEKLSFLIETLTSRMLSLIAEMRQGRDANPALYAKFLKAKEGLLRETKNYRLDSPYEVASYNSRLLIEESVWDLNDYIDEMEGEFAERDPLTLEECATVAEECLMGRVKAEILCMGNINKEGAIEVGKVIEDHFLKASRPLSDVEKPRFRSLKLPTKEEAAHIFGPEVQQDRVIPLVYQELAISESEETNAVEFILQAGCGLDLGYEGIALLELIAHMAYNSAYNQLRTKEQLGYIVSAFVRKTAGGTWGLSVVVQSSAYLPEFLEERIEAWLGKFAEELEQMNEDDIAAEAYSVLSQLLEQDTRLSQEVGRIWGDILNTEPYCGVQVKLPIFDRLAYLADELTIYNSNKDDKNISKRGRQDEQDSSSSSSRNSSRASTTTTTAASVTMLNGTKRKNSQEFKRALLDFFNDKFATNSKNRREMSSRVYNHKAKSEYEKDLKKPGVFSTFSEMRYVKQFLSSWPVAPYYWKLSSSDKKQ